MSFEKPDESTDRERNVNHGVASEGSGLTVKAGNRPYFGMTGTQLNIWVTVACTTAMTLFGEFLWPAITLFTYLMAR